LAYSERGKKFKAPLSSFSKDKIRKISATRILTEEIKGSALTKRERIPNAWNKKCKALESRLKTKVTQTANLVERKEPSHLQELESAKGIRRKFKRNEEKEHTRGNFWRKKNLWLRFATMVSKQYLQAIQKQLPR